MTDPDDTSDPPPSGKHCRTCPAPLPPRTGRYIGLCPGCLAEIRARVIDAMAEHGVCMHERHLGSHCALCGGTAGDHRRERWAAARCIRCPAVPERGWECNACRARKYATRNAKYRQVRDAGLCRRCRKPSEAMLCPACRVVRPATLARESPAARNEKAQSPPAVRPGG